MTYASSGLTSIGTLPGYRRTDVTYMDMANILVGWGKSIIQ